MNPTPPVDPLDTPQTPSAHLLLPPKALASCIALAVARDTRGLSLSDVDRMNYFPASPLVTLTSVLEGQLHMAQTLCDLPTLRALPACPNTFVLPPQPTPIVSWSPGPVTAITIGFYPDAWRLLGGSLDEPPEARSVEASIAALNGPNDVAAGWEAFCASLLVVWRAVLARKPSHTWKGSHRLDDWVRHLAMRASLSGPGRSARALERRVKRWSGHSRQTLDFFARIDELHALTVRNPGAQAAQIAQEGAFSDQSHMGRTVKRATGFSPVQLNRRIQAEEAFWCYRLLGERF